MENGYYHLGFREYVGYIGLSRDNGKENGNYHFRCRGYVGVSRAI